MQRFVMFAFFGLMLGFILFFSSGCQDLYQAVCLNTQKIDLNRQCGVDCNGWCACDGSWHCNECIARYRYGLQFGRVAGASSCP